MTLKDYLDLEDDDVLWVPCGNAMVPMGPTEDLVIVHSPSNKLRSQLLSIEYIALYYTSLSRGLTSDPDTIVNMVIQQLHKASPRWTFSSRPLN